MAIGSKKLLELFELVSAGWILPAAALEIALGKTSFPSELETATETTPATGLATVEPAAPAAALNKKIIVVAATPLDQHLTLECERIAALANVQRVAVHERHIHVFTNTIYCTDPSNQVVHEIGRFRIELPLVDNTIRWYNLDRTVWGRQALHVSLNGTGVLGNMTDVFPQLLAQRDFSIAATMAIAFVESVNVDDPWGKDIGDWPVAQPKPAAADAGLSPTELADVLNSLGSYKVEIK